MCEEQSSRRFSGRAERRRLRLHRRSLLLFRVGTPKARILKPRRPFSLHNFADLGIQEESVIAEKNETNGPSYPTELLAVLIVSDCSER